MLERLVEVDYVQNTPDNFRTEHCHEHHEAILIRSGAYSAQVAGHELIARPGELVVYPSATTHRPTYAVDGGLQMMLCKWFDDRQIEPRALVLHDDHGRLSFMLDWLWQLNAESGRTARGHQRRVFRVWVAELHNQLEQHTSASGAGDDRIRHIQTYLAANLHRNLDLGEIARTIPCTKEHMIRQYKQATGVTPYQDLLRLRVEKARQLLLATDLSVTEVANQVGFQTAGRLQVVVKRATGRTPAQWRRSS